MYLVVIFAVCLHIVWGFCLLGNSDAVGVTGIHTLSYVIDDPTVLGMVLLSVACLALIGVTQKSLFAFALLLPQQAVLFVSSWGALFAMCTGQFADGVVRPHTFLIADQCHLLICAVLHFIAAMRKALQD